MKEYDAQGQPLRVYDMLTNVEKTPEVPEVSRFTCHFLHVDLIRDITHSRTSWLWVKIMYVRSLVSV
jgi:hypothetical protein